MTSPTAAVAERRTVASRPARACETYAPLLTRLTWTTTVVLAWQVRITRTLVSYLWRVELYRDGVGRDTTSDISLVC